MNEVELTSEFMILIMRGILEKSNRTIDSFYRFFDDRFDEQREVAERFRTVFDTIAAHFPQEELAANFSRKAVFFALFAAIYGLQYGLASPKTTSPGEGRTIKPAKAKALKARVVQNIKTAGEKIAKESLPAPVSRSLRGATAHARERRIVIGFLTGADDDPCPIR
jgi:hypothetical protein